MFWFVSLSYDIKIWFTFLSKVLSTLWPLIRTKQVVEEAGGTITRMDGGKFCVFDRSVLVSNGILHNKVRLDMIVSIQKG